MSRKILSLLLVVAGVFTRCVLASHQSEFWVPHVRDVLNLRLDDVIRGRRAEQFGRQYRLALKANKNQDHEQSITVKDSDNEHAHFPSDIMCLGFSDNDHESESESQDKLTLWNLSLRALKLSWNFAPAICTSWLALASEKYREAYWFPTLSNCIAHSGPAFIKWGQWASTRTDMFPVPLCEALSHLHSDAPEHSWKITKKTIEQSLKLSSNGIHEIFSYFDPNPIASGSVAQVHRATLKGSNEMVAVKVRHPQVASMIAKDFWIMTKFAALLPFKDVQKSVEQFSHTMAAQAHLQVEAQHLEVLNYNFRDWKHISFPRPIFASPSIIIETFERGHICSDYITAYERDADSTVSSGHKMPSMLQKFIVASGTSLYLKMLLVDNMMHADLHPGNIMLDIGFYNGNPDDGILLHPGRNNPLIKSSSATSLVTAARGGQDLQLVEVENEEKEQISDDHRGGTMQPLQDGGYFHGRITLVDAGMVAILDPTESTNFIKLLASLGEADAITAANCMLQFTSPQTQEEIDKWYTHPDGIVTSLNPEERNAFTADVKKLFEKKCGGYGTNVDVGEVLRGMLEIIKCHRLRIDANYATLVVNALCIEGLARRVCPSYNVLDGCKPLLKSHSYYLSMRYAEQKDGDSHNPQNLLRCLKLTIQNLKLRIVTKLLYLRKYISDEKFFKDLNRQKHVAAHERQESTVLLGKIASFVFNNSVRLVGVYFAAQQGSQLLTGERTPFHLDSIPFPWMKKKTFLIEPNEETNNETNEND